jgi:outer membrane protein assembly factor BamB
MSQPTHSSSSSAIPLGIGVAGLLLAGGFWIWHGDDRTNQIIAIIYVAAPTILLMVGWWLLLSGVGWRSRLVISTVFLAVVGLLAVSFRMDGYWGSFVPRFSPRWSLTAEERAEKFWNSQQTVLSAKEHDPASKAGADAAERNSGQPARLEIGAGDWPQFRGPGRNGIVPSTPIRRDWNQNPPKLLWRHPVGPAWSSFAVVETLAFTQEQRVEEEAVVCYGVETGDQIWAHTDQTRFATVMGGIGPRATPTLHDSRLYTLGATGILNCLEPRTGSLIWSRNILDDAGARQLQWGFAGSPLVYDDVVVVNAGGREGKGVAAYNRNTGEPVWAEGKRSAGYATPVLADIRGDRQLLVFGNKGIAGHDADTGRELWWFEWKNDTGNNCTQPISLGDGTVLVSTGYSKGSVLLDVKEVDGEWSALPTGWKTSSRFKLKFNGAIRQGGFLYGLSEGILTCFDLSTGKHRWKRGRYGYGQLLLIDDALLVSAESGEVALVEVSTERYFEHARFQAIEGKTWNHPVLHQGRLLVRNNEEAACYDLRPPSETARID